MLLAIVQVMVGHFQTGEQPGFGFMRATHSWMWLSQLVGVFELLFDRCGFQKVHRKTTRLISGGPLKVLAVQCNQSKGHPKLEGTATTLASEYSLAFCHKVASFWKGHEPVWNDIYGGWDGRLITDRGIPGCKDGIPGCTGEERDTQMY